MTRQRAVVVLTFVAVLAAFTALAALAAGGTFLFGTLTAGERQVFAGATIVALLAAVALLLMTRGSAEIHLGPVGGAATGFVAALALSPLAVLAFTTPVTTASDDSSGCGTISSPNTVFDQVRRETVITPTCAERLKKQKLLAGALVAPSGLLAGFSLAAGLKAGTAG